MEKNTLRVGMRNVKTALAIFVCLLLYQFVPGNASYACIAALIAMQSTLEESWSQGRNRLLGT
ncbi:aromatic acid exporter family protein, partial [Anaerotruncus rubiinfantis]